MTANPDIIVIGAGIVGLSTALQLSRAQPDARILLLEKETGPAHHQTGRNSGVVHAGVYYQPGSLKARFCIAGSQATREFCHEHDIPYQQPGKLLVARDESELGRMDQLFERCRQNGLHPERLNQQELCTEEPAVTGAGAILVRQSAITDYSRICAKMLALFESTGGQVQWNCEIQRIRESDSSVTVHTDSGDWQAAYLVACAGLMADRVARLQGLELDFRVVPFRGEYYQLASSRSSLVHRLIYPIPDPALPFLGIHITPRVDGSIIVGPNAVQAWKREGYGRFNINLQDSAEILGHAGWWKFVRKNLGHGLSELKGSLLKRHYLSQLNGYCPSLRLPDLKPFPVGIRAQVIRNDGSMVDDFLFRETGRSIHVCNAPSPAATSAIPIGKHIADMLDRKMGACQ